MSSRVTSELWFVDMVKEKQHNNKRCCAIGYCKGNTGRNSVISHFRRATLKKFFFRYWLHHHGMIHSRYLEFRIRVVTCNKRRWFERELLSYLQPVIEVENRLMYWINYWNPRQEASWKWTFELSDISDQEAFMVTCTLLANGFINVVFKNDFSACSNHDVLDELFENDWKKLMLDSKDGPSEQKTLLEIAIARIQEQKRLDEEKVVPSPTLSEDIDLDYEMSMIDCDMNACSQGNETVLQHVEQELNTLIPNEPEYLSDDVLDDIVALSSPDNLN
eukprot:m.102106 g.102106  ORF g.102106 m.102106 type:complete len:276 (+) comp13760_c0_seq3:439-1266(+)